MGRLMSLDFIRCRDKRLKIRILGAAQHELAPFSAVMEAERSDWKLGTLDYFDTVSSFPV